MAGVSLDSADVFAATDPSGALRAVVSTAGQVRAAIEVAGAAGPLPERSFTSIVFCGMGGSGLGGDLVAALASASGRVPVVVHKSYGLPAFAGPRTLVIASSYSGGTEETVDAMRRARDAGAWGIAIASGGALAAEAEQAGWLVLRPEGGLMPRYALGWLIGLPVAICERLGLVAAEPGWRDDVPALLDRRAAEWGAARPEAENAAKQLARKLEGRFPVVWGAQGVSAVAATRWRNDLNENAKVYAHAATLPELDHHEIVGFAAEGRDGRPEARRALVCLREPDERPEIAARFAETVREVKADFELVAHVTASGPGPLARFVDLALLGGFVSCYLAVLRGVDPAPVASIFRLKDALGRRGS